MGSLKNRDSSILTRLDMGCSSGPGGNCPDSYKELTGEGNQGDVEGIPVPIQAMTKNQCSEIMSQSQQEL